MNRLGAEGFRDPIATAKSMIPAGILDRVEYADFFVGSNPWAAGLLQGQPTERTFADGETNSYAEMAFCLYGHAQVHLPVSGRRTTIVLPPTFHRDYQDLPGVVVHEMGHVLHEVLNWDWFAEPVTAYARENWLESFAEAFDAWVRNTPDLTRLRERDPATVALFERLAA